MFMKVSESYSIMIVITVNSTKIQANHHLYKFVRDRKSEVDYLTGFKLTHQDAERNRIRNMTLDFCCNRFPY